MSILSPWDSAFYEGNKIKFIQKSDEIIHWGDVACDIREGGSSIPAQPEAPGKLNVYTGEYTYAANAVGSRKTPEQLERIRRDYISAQANLITPLIADKFKSSKSAADIFKYIDEEFDDTKFWRFDDKHSLLERVTWAIRTIREDIQHEKRIKNAKQ
jgi:hypothetical protein